MNKTLLIGWDAADWKVIHPLMAAGEMPNLERFVAEGAMGNLCTLQPILSPMLWTSIATGKRAYKHGIHGFSEPDPASGGARPVTNLGRKVRAVWNMLQLHGLKSNVVGWWPSFPPEPISGVMVSNHFHTAPKNHQAPWPVPVKQVHPERLAGPLSEFRVRPEQLTAEQLLPFVPKAAEIDQDKDKRLFSVAKILAETATVHGAATALMQLEPWDFMAVYFDAIDHFGHGFMKYHPPRQDWIDEQSYSLYKDVVASGYRFHDMMLGTYMALAGPDTNILICSDHGFHPDHLRPREIPNEPAGPAAEHRQFGVFAAWGPDIAQDRLVHGASLLDITPTILQLYGLPIGRDMDGKPLLDALRAPGEVRLIDSWEDLDGDDGRHPEDARVDPVDARESMQQLVDLGYVEAVDEDRDKAARQTVRELRYNLARDLMDAHRWADAAELLDELWETDPDEVRFGAKLFDCRLAQGHTAAARETLNRLVERKTAAAKAAKEELEQIRAGWDKDEDGRAKPPEDLPEDAQRQLRKLRKRAGVNRITLAFFRGRLLRAEGRHADALAALEQAAGAQMHNQPSLLQARGELLLRLHRHQEAERVFQEILSIDPVNAQAQFGLAQSYLGRKGLEEPALAALGASLALIYHNPRGHYLRGAALMRLKRFDDAIAAFETAVAQNSVYPAAHRRLARLYLRQRQDTQAAEHHQALARAALQRLAEHRAGAPLPSKSEAELAPVAAGELATLADMSATDALPSMAPDTVVIVSGLPRSGTSMAMQMLAAGGLPVLVDDKRAADDDNPKGYFEYAPTKATADSPDWLLEARGKAVKLVAQLLPRIGANLTYRIVFMERPLNEVIASQRAMLERTGKQGGRLSDRRLARTYLQQIAGVRAVLKRYPEQVALLSVNYHDALADPAGNAARINAFLGGVLDETAMTAAVEPALRRQGGAQAAVVRDTV